MSEVPLQWSGVPKQGDLAHKKTPTPLGEPYGPTCRVLGGAFSYERGSPVTCGRVTTGHVRGCFFFFFITIKPRVE